MTDELTGLYSRRYFFAALRQQATRGGRLSRSGTPPTANSCLMIDVDHFKTINDRLGHLAGDEILRSIADVVRSSIRGGDVAARFGGEEIAVLLPETSDAGALAAAEKIRAGVERMQGVESTLTVSVGVATLPVLPLAEQTAAGTSYGELLLRTADRALYEAKRAGRNRVVAAA